MSVMRCDQCDGFVDTDDDVEGLWGVNNETPNGEDFICSACCDRLGLYDAEVLAGGPGHVVQ